MPMPLKIYAWYKGDDYIFEGTLAEFAAFRGIELEYARVITSPSYQSKASSYESMTFKVPLAKITRGKIIEL